MGMLPYEMKKGLKCYVNGHSVRHDSKSICIVSSGTILEKPCLGTVLVELDNPPKGISKRYRVPVESVYWAKQE